MITSNILQRVLHIRYGDEMGSAFTIEVDSAQYLITAKHVLKGLGPDATSVTIEIFYNGNWSAIRARVIHCEEDTADIVVLAAPQVLTPWLPLVPTSVGARLSQDIYFLGFPYGMFSEAGTVNNDFPFPFVKKGIISALASGHLEVWHLEGVWEVHAAREVM